MEQFKVSKLRIKFCALFVFLWEDINGRNWSALATLVSLGQPWQPACRHFPAHDKARATQTMISLSRPSLAKIKLGPALSSYMVEALSF